MGFQPMLCAPKKQVGIINSIAARAISGFGKKKMNQSISPRLTATRALPLFAVIFLALGCASPKPNQSPHSHPSITLDTAREQFVPTLLTSSSLGHRRHTSNARLITILSGDI